MKVTCAKLEVIVRNCRREDLPRVYEINLKAFSQPHQMVEFSWFYEMEPSGTYIAVDKNRNKIIGFVFGVYRPVFFYLEKADIKDGWIPLIAVDPEYQKRGIGTLLMQTIEEYLRSKGAKEVKVEVRENNTGALEYYNKIGFEIHKKIPNYYFDGENGIIMKKNLQKKIDIQMKLKLRYTSCIKCGSFNIRYKVPFLLDLNCECEDCGCVWPVVFEEKIK